MGVLDDYVNRIITGDCCEVMRQLPDNSIDLVVTDPPYGIGFMGKDWDKALPPRDAFEEMLRVLKPGALAFIMSSPRQDVLWRMLAMLEEVGFELKQSFISWIYKTGFPKAYDISKGIDRRLGAERKKVKAKVRSHTKYHSRAGNTRPWFKLAEEGRWMVDSDEPVSEEAKRWNGWKSIAGLKPALECILMVYKPLSEKTIVDNVLKWGTGAINVDICRIPTKEDLGRPISKREEASSVVAYNWSKYPNPLRGQFIDNSKGKGRFPANLLVSDRALDTGKITKSKIRKPSKTELENDGYKKMSVYGKYYEIRSTRGVEDIGDQSRFFDLDAWAKHHGFLDVPKPSKRERDMGLNRFPIRKVEALRGNFDGSINKRTKGQPSYARNTHPTVKPVKLMAYLIELGCPPSGVVLDPFVGSGTTCIAAKQLRRKWIGIELNPEYAEMARARVEAAKYVKRPNRVIPLTEILNGEDAESSKKP